MQSEFIPLWEAIRAMRTPDEKGKPTPFDLTFIKLDKRRKTAGGIKSLVGQILLRTPRKSIAEAHQERLNEISNVKNPNHDLHRTINVYDRVTGKRTKVHVRLIVEFNSKRVRY